MDTSSSEIILLTDACCMHMNLPCGMQHVSVMSFHAFSFMCVHHGIWLGSPPGFLRTADFGSSQKARRQTPSSRCGACPACAHHYLYHERCACSMPCRARAYGAFVGPILAPAPAWQQPAERQGCMQHAFLCMHSFLHVMLHPYGCPCCMPCNKSVLQARET